MARVFGVDIPNNKSIGIALTYVYGVGKKTATSVLGYAGIDPKTRTSDLKDDQLAKITQAVSSREILIEGDLRREHQASLKRLTMINCYRGIRHKLGLPVRGQRTSTNARTRKGKIKTVGVIAKGK